MRNPFLSPRQHNSLIIVTLIAVFENSLFGATLEYLVVANFLFLTIAFTSIFALNYFSGSFENACIGIFNMQSSLDGFLVNPLVQDDDDAVVPATMVGGVDQRMSLTSTVTSTINFVDEVGKKWRLEPAQMFPTPFDLIATLTVIGNIILKVEPIS